MANRPKKTREEAHEKENKEVVRAYYDGYNQAIDDWEEWIKEKTLKHLNSYEENVGSDYFLND